MATSLTNNEKNEASNLLLSCARNGEDEKVNDLLLKRIEGSLHFDINVKGQHKANKGWSALHLASYFGHLKIVKLLLENGVDVNAVNDNGDTALHRATFTSRKDIVLLLLSYGADVSIINGEGLTPRGLSKNSEITSMIEAAETYELKKKEQEFLAAVMRGDVKSVQSMLPSEQAPDINCRNSVGNSALHIAALRNLSQMAVVLLQEKIDVTLENNCGQQAVQLASDAHMKQLLGVVPVRSIPTLPQRHEGAMYKKVGVLGYKLMWVVVERGVFSCFRNRGDASTGSRKKNTKYLDNARVIMDSENVSKLVVNISDGTTLHLQLDWQPDVILQRQRWVNAITEHIAYSTHYTHQGMVQPTKIKPLESVTESIQTAQAHERIFEQEVQQLESVLESLNIDGNSVKSGDIVSLRCHLQHLLMSAKDTCYAFTETLDVFTHQNKVMTHQMNVEVERSRVLQESLHALATEHHQLEQSLGRQRRASSVTDDDEFFECMDDDLDGDVTWAHNDPTLNDASQKENNNCDIIKHNVDLGRTKLPVPMFSRSDFSVWSILKQCIGKELSKITMPLIFNEPLSFLQRLAEYLEYSYLLDKACQCDDVVERMQYVAAFAVSAISSNWERIGKPFNPLLGETYELNRPDLGYRLMSEQVSHHPPVSAFHVDSPNYRFSGSIQPKLKFWGKSVEVNPRGTMKLELLKHNEVYTWQNVNCCVHNVVIGKLWVEHYGTMDIQNHTTKHRCGLNFRQGGWFGKDLHKLEGYIYSPEKKKLKAIYGSWISGLYAVDVDKFDSLTKTSSKLEVSRSFTTSSRTNGTSSPKPAGRCHSTESLENTDVSDDIPCTEFPYNLNIHGQQLLWRVTPRPSNSNQYFNFTHFAMMLNEFTPSHDSRLPPTDVRLRPDIRLMENGEIDAGAAEKNRMEEKQRAVRKDRKKFKSSITPLWFDWAYNEFMGKDDWVFNHKYFDRDWQACPDIF